MHVPQSSWIDLCVCIALAAADNWGLLNTLGDL
jgi:hypothetical protein